MPDTQAMVTELIPAMRAFARSFCPDPSDADDLVQQTLMRALMSLDQYEPGTKLKAWMFTIMRNAFYTSIKRYNREKPGAAADIASEFGNHRSVPASQNWTAAVREVHFAMNRLPDVQREALVLIAILGTSYEDAAEICNCEVGTIKSRTSRARSNLLALLGESDAYEFLAEVA